MLGASGGPAGMAVGAISQGLVGAAGAGAMYKTYEALGSEE
jgi:hypothetical protein